MTIPLTKKQIIPQDKWDLYTFKIGEYWGFNLLEYCITNEIFCWGTEDSITELFKLKFGKDPNWGSDLMIHFSKDQPEDYITTWEFIEPYPSDPNSGYYTCTTTGLTIWLCELWTNMWGGFPQTLYLTID